MEREESNSDAGHNYRKQIIRVGMSAIGYYCNHLPSVLHGHDATDVGNC